MASHRKRAGPSPPSPPSPSSPSSSWSWPEERGEREQGLYSLHRMFDIVGAHLTHRDVRVLSFLFVDVLDEAERGRIRSGRDFLLALERQGRCDESNLRQLLQLLRIITRHDLLPYVTLKRRRAGEWARHDMGDMWGQCHDLLPYVTLKRRRTGTAPKIPPNPIHGSS
ncbi:PREDICTED: death effector domain-containing protein-like [Lepidothrix coronata]|uniref:Death effector domain-containing protein n=1 Tax=Lepidothrix coronata TaxID=321398 RepID=A0A6J0J921_9PASS|nr:PREDICTED: death effector domain-containing protein-like [Lepidothrix coronata]